MQTKFSTKETTAGLILVILTPILIILLIKGVLASEDKARQAKLDEKEFYTMSLEEETDPNQYIEKVVNKWNQDGKSKDEVLKECFVSLMYSLEYQKLHDGEAINPTQYDISALAQETMDHKGGNCANMTAMFYKTAKAVGYDPVFCYGKVRQGSLIDNHCWVEIQDSEGEWKIYDLTFDMTPGPQTYDTLEYFNVNDSVYREKGGELTKLGTL